MVHGPYTSGVYSHGLYSYGLDLRCDQVVRKASRPAANALKAASAAAPVGHNDTGHNYIGHNHIGHNHIGHNYIGNNYIGHNHIGWSKTCGKGCAKPECERSGGSWIALDYNSNPYTCQMAAGIVSG